MKVAGKIIFLSLVIFCAFLTKKPGFDKIIPQDNHRESLSRRPENSIEKSGLNFDKNTIGIKDSLTRETTTINPNYPFEGVSYAIFYHYRR